MRAQGADRFLVTPYDGTNIESGTSGTTENDSHICSAIPATSRRSKMPGRAQTHVSTAARARCPRSARLPDEIGCIRMARVGRYGSLVRTNLTVEDLGGFLDQPLVAVIATLRTDGSVLLSPVWYEWRDGGFNVWVEAQNVKVRHLRRDPRSTIVVAESAPPLRGVEVRGIARIIEDGVTETARRIAARYLAEDEAAADTDALRGADVIIRIEPGHVRVWDYADEFDRD